MKRFYLFYNQENLIFHQVGGKLETKSNLHQVGAKMQSKDDNQTIGILICKTKDKVVAEYALADIHKPLGVSSYDFKKILPMKFKSALPSIEEIERELQD